MGNHSATNFCIYGVLLSSKEIELKLKESYKSCLIKDDKYETLENLFQNQDGWIYEEPFENGNFYVGMSFSEIGDNETGSQFKEKVRSMIKNYFNIKDSRFHTYQETYFY